METRKINGSLRIVEVGDLRTAEDGRQFFTIGMRAGFGQKVAYRNLWQQFKKDADGIELEPKVAYWERGSREDAIALMKSGEIVEGRKVTHTVETYQIGENVVSTYSTIVFADENEVTVFNQAGHPIVDTATGELIEGARRKAVISAADPGEEEQEEEPEVEVEKPQAR
jgi:hypothetical protein